MERLDIYRSSGSHNKQNLLKSWLYKIIVKEKMFNVFGLIFFLLSGILIALGIATTGSIFTLGVLGILIGLPVIYGIVFIPVFGITFLLVMAYLLFSVTRFGVDFPFGTIMDGIEFLLIIGLFIKRRAPIEWRIQKDPISIMIFVWIGYNVLELINPSSNSMIAWFYTIRSVAFVMLMYFVFRFHIRTVWIIRMILKIWLFLSLLAALYALKQEYLGFSAFELEWLHSDPRISDLLFIDGHWRKFSFLSDPVAFSYNMVISSILAICLLGATTKTWKRIILVSVACIFLWAMSFSGTRGAYVLIPAALFFYTVLNFNKIVFGAAIVAGMVLIVLIFIPTSNPTLYRFQSAFRPSQDASFLLRKANQDRIRPYIITHPLGGGLGATGVWGKRFSPNSLLANFPPDSGYVRVAVELGWLGLFIFCLLMFIILMTSIQNYFRIRDPELKAYCLAMILIIFALNIGNYPQEALIQFPTSIYFYLVTALASVTWQIDKETKKLKADGE